MPTGQVAGQMGGVGVNHQGCRRPIEFALHDPGGRCTVGLHDGIDIIRGVDRHMGRQQDQADPESAVCLCGCGAAASAANASADSAFSRMYCCTRSRAVS